MLKSLEFEMRGPHFQEQNLYDIFIINFLKIRNVIYEHGQYP